MRGKRWKYISAWAACVLAISAGSLTTYAETGATGYPKVVRVQGLGGSEAYLTVENAAEWQKGDPSGKRMMPVEPKGFYELDGHVVYLEWSDLVKMKIVDGYFADENGYLQPYTPETKAGIDAHINAVL